MRSARLRRLLSLVMAATAAAACTSPGAVAHPAQTHDEGLSSAAVNRLTRALAFRAEPPLTATPRASCGPGSRPEPGMQGRVPAGAGSANGFTCNTTQLGHEGVAGGFRVHRFVDKAGHECAYYDTTLLFPLNAVTLNNPQPAGVAVLDMSDPANPVRTSTLMTPAMQTPHESVSLNERRGLLAAGAGNAATYPGVVDIYDINADCRFPALQSSLPVGVLGHEGNFAPDGRTLYIANPGGGPITALDVTNPQLPIILWTGNYTSHGLTISEDGNRAYVADAFGGLLILDTSQIQARRTNPQERVVSRLRWESMTIPQTAIPVTINSHPYVVEVDEYSADANGQTTSHGIRVGAARIIDIADETTPRVVSNMRLEVHQPENRAAVADDPGAFMPVQGYAGHYCHVPSRHEPGIVACSFIVSGLRVFDIRNPLRPKELAYFVAPPRRHPNAPGDFPLSETANFAMSAPAFVPARGEIWYSDGNSGFYAVRVTHGVWPFLSHTGAGQAASSRSCTGANANRRLAASFFPVGGLARTRGKRLYARLCAPATVTGVKVVLSDLRGRVLGSSVARSFRGSRIFSIRLKQFLAPGRYRLTATGRNPNGRSASVSMRVRFR